MYIYTLLLSKLQVRNMQNFVSFNPPYQGWPLYLPYQNFPLELKIWKRKFFFLDVCSSCTLYFLSWFLLVRALWQQPLLEPGFGALSHLQKALKKQQHGAAPSMQPQCFFCTVPHFLEFGKVWLVAV